MAQAKAPTPSAAANPSSYGSAPSAGSKPSGGNAPSANAQPLISAAHQPTPAQQNPSVRKPLAPTLPEKSPDGPDPVRALADRQRAAIASRVAGHEREQVSGAGVDGASPPPKPSKSSSPSGSPPARSAPAATTPTNASTKERPGSSAPAPAAQPSTEGDSTPSQSSDDTSTQTADTESDPSAADSPEGSQTSAKRGPRYELKPFKRWAEENPEQAAELAKAVFQIDVGEGFIKLQNKARKIKGEIREQRTAAETAAQEKLQAAQTAQAEAERIAGSLRYMADMWAAAQRKDEQGRPMLDFDTIDESFRQNSGGLSIDDYMRQRARRGVSSPELARERASRLRLEAELAQLKGNNGAARGAQEANGAGAQQQAKDVVSTPAQAPALAAPQANPEELWGDELPKTHQLREFRGWADELHREMQRHYDETLDEYSADPEEIADKLLERRLAAFRAEEEPAAPPKRPVPGKRPNTPKRRAAPAGDGMPSASELTPKGHRPVAPEELSDEMPKDFVSRERWALDRAQRRLRGEAVK
jgi:hypothetical protein